MGLNRDEFAQNLRFNSSDVGRIYSPLAAIILFFFGLVVLDTVSIMACEWHSILQKNIYIILYIFCETHVVVFHGSDLR